LALSKGLRHVFLVPPVGRCEVPSARFEAAYRYLNEEFTRLDTDINNSRLVYPVRADLRTVPRAGGVAE